MLRIFKDNLSFFIPFLVYIFLGFLILFNTEQGAGIMFFSENRTPFADFFFINGTKLGEELVYAFFFTFFLFIRFRYSILVALTALAVTSTSFLLKGYFRHSRPRRYYGENGILDEINMVDEVIVLGGSTSFPSGHTMSAFALYGIIAFIFPKKYIGFMSILFAIIIGTSRIYLVQHFVKDVVFGAILGVLIAMILYNFNLMLKTDKNKWFDGSIANRNKKKVV